MNSNVLRKVNFVIYKDDVLNNFGTVGTGTVKFFGLAQNSFRWKLSRNDHIDLDVYQD